MNSKELEEQVNLFAYVLNESRVSIEHWTLALQRAGKLTRFKNLEEILFEDKI